MADNSVFCSRCGAANNAAAVFCQSCGAAMTPGAAIATTATAPAVAYAQPATAVYNPYGGFWLRVVATLLDGVIIGAVTIPLALIFLLPVIIRLIHLAQANQEPPLDLFFPFFFMVPLVVAGVWLYESLLTSSSWQGTVGKRVLRLKVTDLGGNRISFGRATGRFFAKLVLRLALTALVYIVVAFTERKQGLHDMIAGTLVMKY